MNKFLFVVLGILVCSYANAQEFKIAVVDVKECVDKSKVGNQEKNNFEALKKQMTESLEKSDRELNDLAKKLEDKDYMDSLSPAAEEELQQKFQMLNQEFSRNQNQYYQLLQQANYRMLHNLQESISTASESIRSKNGLTLILNRDSAFAFDPSLDITNSVIKEMDKNFEIENSGKKAAVADENITPKAA